MSTIHRPAPLNLWWYAAGAALIAAVLVLTILTLWPSGPETANSPGGETANTYVKSYKLTPYPCFAKRAGSNIELAHCGVHPGQ
jgi:hypothetical protein